MELESFKKTSYLTLIVLFLLIGVGALVSVTHSGMGCPDWPKCFGLWVPPTCECELPDNYHDLYKDHGYPQGVYFDPVKTWIEYFNRLLGVVAGIVVLVNLVVAFKARKYSKEILYGSFVCFLLVVSEGLLGALEVKFNLQTQLVTVHYLLAIVAVSSLMYSIGALNKSLNLSVPVVDRQSLYYISVALGITVIQLISGVHLRSILESLSEISVIDWLHLNDKAFIMHRFYAVLFLISNLLLWQKFNKYRFTRTAFKVIWICITFQFVTGILLNYFNFPQLAQVIHIMLPAIIFCSQFYIFSFIFLNKESVKDSG